MTIKYPDVSFENIAYCLLENILNQNTIFPHPNQEVVVPQT